MGLAMLDSFQMLQKVLYAVHSSFHLVRHPIRFWTFYLLSFTWIFVRGLFGTHGTSNFVPIYTQFFTYILHWIPSASPSGKSSTLPSRSWDRWLTEMASKSLLPMVFNNPCCCSTLSRQQYSRSPLYSPVAATSKNLWPLHRWACSEVEHLPSRFIIWLSVRAWVRTVYSLTALKDHMHGFPWCCSSFKCRIEYIYNLHMILVWRCAWAS